jgi:hypothetical protein
MFPVLGLLTVCIVTVAVAVGVISCLPGIRVTVGNVLVFAIAAVPCSFASAFIVGSILGERYTFFEGIAALAIGSLAGGLVAVLVRNRFLKH